MTCRPIAKATGGNFLLIQKQLFPRFHVIRSMQKALLTIFFVCMFSCAGTVLFVIWFGETMESEYILQFAATCFVIGLAAFLSWFVWILFEIHSRIVETQ